MARRAVTVYMERPNATSVWIVRERTLPVIFAHSDGVKWTVGVDWLPNLPKMDEVGAPQAFRASSLASMPLEARNLREWVEKNFLVKPAGFYGQGERPQDEGLFAEPFEIDGKRFTVTFVGFGKKVGAYEFAKIREIVSKSVRLCVETWGWSPGNLQLSLIAKSRAMGMAYEPGTGAESGIRRVSLSRDLFARFDANSIHRTLIHELCHHYREETWPRKRTIGFNSHDDRFCAELGRVDPVVRDAKSCTFFDDDVDASLVDAAKAKKDAARAKHEAGITWAPNAGMVLVDRLKSGKIKMGWHSRPGFSWRPLVEEVNDMTLSALLKRFAPAQWREVEVVLVQSVYPFKSGQRVELQMFAEAMVRVYAKILKQSAGLLTAVNSPS